MSDTNVIKIDGDIATYSDGTTKNLKKATKEEKNEALKSYIEYKQSSKEKTVKEDKMPDFIRTEGLGDYLKQLVGLKENNNKPVVKRTEPIEVTKARIAEEKAALDLKEKTLQAKLTENKYQGPPVPETYVSPANEQGLPMEARADGMEAVESGKYDLQDAVIQQKELEAKAAAFAESRKQRNPQMTNAGIMPSFDNNEIQQPQNNIPSGNGTINVGNELAGGNGTINVGNELAGGNEIMGPPKPTVMPYNPVTDSGLINPQPQLQQPQVGQAPIITKSGAPQSQIVNQAGGTAQPQQGGAGQPEMVKVGETVTTKGQLPRTKEGKKLMSDVAKIADSLEKGTPNYEDVYTPKETAEELARVQEEITKQQAAIDEKQAMTFDDYIGNRSEQDLNNYIQKNEVFSQASTKFLEHLNRIPADKRESFIEAFFITATPEQKAGLLERIDKSSKLTDGQKKAQEYRELLEKLDNDPNSFTDDDDLRMKELEPIYNTEKLAFDGVSNEIRQGIAKLNELKSEEYGLKLQTYGGTKEAISDVDAQINREIKDYEAEMKELYQKSRKEYEDIDKMKVDPTRFFNNARGTLAWLGMALAGAAQAFVQIQTGQKVGPDWNQMLNKLVDRDIKLQQDEILLKKDKISLAAQALKDKQSEFKDARAGLLAHKASMLQSLGVMQRNYALKQGDEQLRLQFMKEANNTMARAAEINLEAYKVSSNEGYRSRELTLRSKQLDMAQGPKPGKDEKPLSDTVIKELSDTQGLISLMKKVKTAFGKVTKPGIVGRYIPAESDSRTFEQLRGMLLSLTGKNLSGAVLSENEVKRISNFFAKAYETKDAGMKAMDQVIDVWLDKLNYRIRGFGTGRPNWAKEWKQSFPEIFGEDGNKIDRSRVGEKT